MLQFYFQSVLLCMCVHVCVCVRVCVLVHACFVKKHWHNTSWPRVTFYCVGSHSKRRYCHTSISKEDYKLVKRIFFFFPKINHVFLQTYRQCNSLEIQKIIHYQSYRCTQGPASCFDCNTVKCLNVFNYLVIHWRLSLIQIPQHWIMGGEGMAGGHKGVKAAFSLRVSLEPFDHTPKTNTVRCVCVCVCVCMYVCLCTQRHMYEHKPAPCGCAHVRKHANLCPNIFFMSFKLSHYYFKYVLFNHLSCMIETCFGGCACGCWWVRVCAEGSHTEMKLRFKKEK